jgi:hypothetical protein
VAFSSEKMIGQKKNVDGVLDSVILKSLRKASSDVVHYESDN